jgi:hypothetical protein
LAMSINRWSIDESTQTFERLAKSAFKQRKVLNIPILSYIHELLASYLDDGLYLAKNLEAALEKVFGTDKSFLNYSHATSTRYKSRFARGDDRQRTVTLHIHQL